ncbi:hypothetical protein Tco_1330251 [Tanacetum coccineum]
MSPGNVAREGIPFELFRSTYPGRHVARERKNEWLDDGETMGKTDDDGFQWVRSGDCVLFDSHRHLIMALR